MCKGGTLLAVDSAWCQLGISGVLLMYSFLNMHHAARPNRSGVLYSLVLDSWPQ